MKLDDKPCFECDKGVFHAVTEDYEVKTPGRVDVLVKGVIVLRCDKCGETLIPAQSSEQIEKEVARICGPYPSHPKRKR